jgi:PAS domain S-box-containing protein
MAGTMKKYLRTPLALIEMFKRFYEKYAPDAVLDSTAPNHWKEKVLYLFILVSISVGLIILILGIPGNVANEYWLIQGSCAAGYLASLFIFLFPKSPFGCRASTACAFIYSIGMSILLTVGPFLASREWLFSFSIIASILLGWPGAIASIVINLLTWVLVGVLIELDYWNNIFQLKDALLYWHMIAIDLLFINISTTILITLFFIRIDQSDRSAKTYSQLLLNERNKLSESNQRLGLEIEDRKTITRALRESEEKYRTILETIEDAYFEVDLYGNLTFFNRALTQRLGYSETELTGMNYRAYTDKSNAEKLYQVFNKVFTTGKSSPPVDLDVHTKSQGQRTVSILVSLLCNNEGEALGFQGLSRDITEHKMMESRLRRAQKMEAVGTLAGGVAHDLNNTLSGVVSYPELLLMKMRENDPMRKPIAAIKKSGERAVAIVQDLLTLARRGVAVKEVTNLNTIITEYLQSTEFQSLQSFHPGVEVKTQLDPALLNLSGSPVHLSKTVMNLVSNAAEAIRENGLITIITENQWVEPVAASEDRMPSGDCVVLRVVDTGGGIAPADIEKIFEPFFTKKVMGRSGTGLGMAVVWGTIQDHGGHIDVKSTTGQGTTFTIYLPATREALPEQEPVLSIDNFKGHGESILIVDDVETQREIATAMLTTLGYQPAMVKSGEEAVEYLKTRTVDLVLLDMIMRPGIDGLETYKRILTLHPGQKAIIASGFSETERVKEAQQLGAGAYIRKPYSIERLGLTIRKELVKNPQLAASNG